MFTRVKTVDEIRRMRESGKRLAQVHDVIRRAVEPGISGRDVSEIAKRELKGLGGEHAFLGQYGFKDVICISVNDAIVHGIPNDTPFKKGDVVGLDYGVKYEGMITDAAISVIVGGSASKEVEQLVKITEQSMYSGIEQLCHGVKVGTISAAIQAVLEENNYGIVRDLAGHGVGHTLHEDPDILNYGIKGTGPSLKAGMTVAIEPMATLGTDHIMTDDDNWTIRTTDGSWSAHWEHTILITPAGYEILTQL